MKVRDVIALLERDSWRLARTRGSHHHYRHAEKPGVVTVPGTASDDSLKAGIAAPGKALNITLWTLQVLVALAFVGAAAGKLLGSADMIALFDAVGVGQWFRYVTGLLELLGALLRGSCFSGRRKPKNVFVRR